MNILGSQVSIFLFMIIGAIVVYAIDKIRKKDMEQEDAESIVGCFTVAGIIFAFACFILYTCTHPEEY